MEYIKQNTRRANVETLNRYIDSVDEMNKMEKALEFPLICTIRPLKNTEGIQAQLYELCEKYYKWLALKERVANYEFNFIDKRWHENCADFVIINDRNLYVSLVELYEILTDDKENSYEEKYKYCVMCHDEIQEIIKKLDRHELKIKKKCK